MGKTYMKPDENEAGVTVEERTPPGRVGVSCERRKSFQSYDDAEARAVVEGLLRRMLEREGAEAVLNVADAVIERGLKELGR